jgi:hypothetical protein
MELLIHLTLNKDMFNLGFGIEEYHPSGLTLALSTNLKSPVLMHQLLAFSSRHLAYLHPERFTFYDHQAVALQTKAISLFNTTYSTRNIDQANCVPVVLFASILGHHTLTDALAWRHPDGIQSFIRHFVQCISTHRGIHTIATTTWPMLMESSLSPILSISHGFTSRSPKGQHCTAASSMVRESSSLSPAEKEASLSALRYLQVGFDAATAEEGEEQNRHHMVCTWPMLLTPSFTSLLSTLHPEALVVLAHYAEILHYARGLWQVRDAGVYILGMILDYLDGTWVQWLIRVRRTVFGHGEGAG